MVSVKDAAKRLGISETRVRQLLKTGQLTGERIGRTWLVSENSVAQRKTQVCPGRPPKQETQSFYMSKPPDVEAAHRLYDECREVLAGCYATGLLNHARSFDEELFWVRVADLFLQEEQRKLIAAGVF